MLSLRRFYDMACESARTMPKKKQSSTASFTFTPVDPAALLTSSDDGKGLSALLKTLNLGRVR